MMKTEGGMVEPLLYGLIGGCAGAFVSFLFSFLLQSMGLFAGQEIHSNSWRAWALEPWQCSFSSRFV